MSIPPLKNPLSASLPILLFPSPRAWNSEEETPLVSVDLISPRRYSAPPLYQSCTRNADSPPTPRVVRIEEPDTCMSKLCCCFMSSVYRV